MIKNNDRSFKDIIKYDSEGNIIYSRELFLLLTNEKFNDMIIEYPELLNVIDKGVVDLFSDWATLDTSLTMSVILLLKCAIANGVPELLGVDLKNISCEEADNVQGEFVDAISKTTSTIKDLAKKHNKKN